ncbi:MAG: response regulator [Archangium sp.]|nr:response regulator [Archangium sp.]
MSAALPKVLVVDDEQNLLVGLSRILRGRFELTLANSGEEALRLFAAGRAFDVIVSDMRMPGMDGVQLLAHARRLLPEATRLILSGHADLESAVRAINEGNLFRFLLKPIKPEELISALDAAVEQRRLLVSERELLELTVTGSIDALSEMLALANPVAHGRARRVRRIVDALATELKLPRPWALEVAASLSQVGAVLLPPETAARWSTGRDLSAEEAAMVARMPAVADQLLKHIPRLEAVRSILSALVLTPPHAREEALEVRVVRAALAFEQALSGGATPAQALRRLQVSSDEGDDQVLGACARLKDLVLGQGVAQHVAIENLREGMVLAADVRTRAGALLISRGHEVTFGLMTALRNYARTVGVAEPLSVELIDTGEELAA